MANIEDIIEINDLASLSIEAGDYHTALDVLNRCLACIRQLKNSDESDSDDENHNNNENGGGDKVPPESRRQQQLASISEVLKSAKEKLMWRRNGTATAAAAVTSNKRKLPPASSESSGTTSTAPQKTATRDADGEGPALRTRRKRRRYCSSQGDDQKTQQQEQEVQQQHSVCIKTTPATAITASNAIVDDDSESGYFIYRKPLRLTESQLERIAEYRRLRRESRKGKDDNKNKNAESQQNQRQRLVQIQREIELAVSSNLVFNIALSHHLIATETDVTSGSGNIERRRRDKEHRLKGALRLYELGFRVHAKRAAAFTSSQASQPSSSSFQRRQQDLYEDEELRSATRYALALINNCAEIHDSLGSTRKADAFRRKLLSFLLMMVDGGESMSAIVSDSDALDGYLKNVFDPIVFRGGESAPAAAA